MEINAIVWPNAVLFKCTVVNYENEFIENGRVWKIKLRWRWKLWEKNINSALRKKISAKKKNCLFYYFNLEREKFFFLTKRSKIANAIYEKKIDL